MKANLALPAVNFFMADVGGGLGAFLSTWLAQTAHWNPAQIGTVIAAGSLAGALLAGPAGALVDRVARPRLLVLLAVVGLFQLANSAMLPLLGQRLVAQGSQNATSWVSGGLIVTQLTMVPVALAAGRLSDRVGRRWLLIAACGIVVVRCTTAAFASANWWLAPVQVLDGLAAALFSVAAPVAAADLTYGTGRTQTALGGMGALQAGGASLAGVMWGFSAEKLGYAATFGAMGMFAVAAVLALLTIHLRDDGGQPGTGTGAGASGNAAAISATV